MKHLRLIVGAGALEGARWARQHLYSLLVLTPMVLGMTYLGVGRMVDEAEWRASDGLSAALAVAAVACLTALSMSRAGVEIYHLRRPESLFDTLPVSADTQLYAALLRRAARASAVALVGLVGRKLAGGALADAWLPLALVLFVAVTAAGQTLAALEWIHWGHRRERGHAAAALVLFVACSAAGGLLLLLVVKPEAASWLSRAGLMAAATLLTVVVFGLLVVLHRRWRASDMEYAKRLGARDRWGRLGERAARRAGGAGPVAAQLARDLQLTLRGFSSAVYVSAGLAALTVVVLVAALTTDLLPAQQGAVSFLEATWLPGVLATKFACVAACVSLAALVPVLVAHQLPHFWLERSVGVRGADAWRAKLLYARVVTLPAALAAWAAGVLSGGAPAMYAVPLLAECVWVWWIVSTLMGALAFEMPEQPGLSLVLMSCAGLAAGGFVAFLWPMGLAIYGMGMDHLSMRGRHRAHVHLAEE